MTRPKNGAQVIFASGAKRTSIEVVRRLITEGAKVRASEPGRPHLSTTRALVCISWPSLRTKGRVVIFHTRGCHQ